MSTNSSRSWWWRSGVALLILLLVYLALPVHRVLPVCHSLMPGQPRWQTVADMSPTFRRLFAEGLRDWKLPFVEVGGVLLTWPHVTFTARFGDARVNVANHLSFPLANPESQEAVLSGLKFGSPARLPPELWQRLWDEPEMDECDQLRIAVHLEPNEP
jgi:hypothetical protein